MEYKLEKSY